MMSRKDYEHAAENIRIHANVGELTAEEHALAVKLFSEFFKDDNPRFSPERFATAAAPTRGPLVGNKREVAHDPAA